MQSGGAKWGILEPHRSETTSALRGVLVGRTLIDLHQSTAVVRLMNLTGQRRKFKKGTEIATANLTGQRRKFKKGTEIANCEPSKM